MTLMKGVLNSILIYTMAATFTPNALIDYIDDHQIQTFLGAIFLMNPCGVYILFTGIIFAFIGILVVWGIMPSLPRVQVINHVQIARIFRFLCF